MLRPKHHHDTKPKHARNEKQIQDAILRHFGKRPDMRLWRQNTGVGFYSGGRVVRYGRVGAADLTGLLAGGRRIEIEVKGPTGRLTPQQCKYGKEIEQYGGIYIVARSIEDVYRGLSEHGVLLQGTRMEVHPAPGEKAHCSELDDGQLDLDFSG